MKTKGSFSDVINSSEVPVLVDVYSDTCGPCIALKPVLKELKNRMGDNLRIIKINGPQNMRFMQQFRIEAFPTLILFDKGKKVWTQLGYTPLDRLEHMIKTKQLV